MFWICMWRINKVFSLSILQCKQIPKKLAGKYVPSQCLTLQSSSDCNNVAAHCYQSGSNAFRSVNLLLILMKTTQAQFENDHSSLWKGRPSGCFLDEELCRWCLCIVKLLIIYPFRKVLRLVCYLKTLLYQKMAMNKTFFGSYMLLSCHFMNPFSCCNGILFIWLAIDQWTVAVVLR